MDKSAKTRAVLFSDTKILTIDQASQLITIGAEILRSTKEKDMVINAIRFALNDTATDIRDSHQILHFFKSWQSEERTQVRSFIISELERIVGTLAVGKITKAEVEADTAELKKQLKSYGRPIKEALERKLVEEFGDDYEKKTAKALKIDREYAVVRFFREDRTPRIKYIKALFNLLDLNELQYFKR